MCWKYLLCLSLACGSTCHAQSAFFGTSTLRMGMHIDSSRKLAKVLGWRLMRSTIRSLEFRASRAGYSADIRLGFQSDSLIDARVTVRSSGRILHFSNYQQIKSSLISIYGVPLLSVRQFDRFYQYGDDRDVVEVIEGRAEISDEWQFPAGEASLSLLKIWFSRGGEIELRFARDGCKIDIDGSRSGN